MDTMLITTFDSDAEAYEGLEALRDLHHKGEITLYATAVITKNFDGEVVVKQEADEGPMGTSLGMLTGALIGLTGGLAGPAIGAATTGLGASIGALTGMTVDVTEFGINADFLEDVSEVLLPGTTAVLAEVDEDSELPVNVLITDIGGLVFRIPRDEVVENQLFDESVALNIEMDEFEAEAKSAKAERKEAMKKTKESIKARLESVVGKANKKIDEINKETEAKVKKLETQLKVAKDTQKAAIEKRIAELKAAQKKRSEKLKEARTRAQEALKPKS